MNVKGDGGRKSNERQRWEGGEEWERGVGGGGGRPLEDRNRG